jgi:hypothetical protein
MGGWQAPLAGTTLLGTPAMAATARFAGLCTVLAIAGAAGCGGDSGPTAEEKRAAKARWVQHVDAACRKANDAISDRGWPRNLIDLDRLVVRGIGDAQAAIKTIAAEPLPEGGGPKPEAFVTELKALEKELTELSEASEDLEPAALVQAADTLKPRLATLEKGAEEAGLSDCFSHDERFFVPDAVRAPVFAEQLARLDRRLLRRIKNVEFAAADTPAEFAVAFRRYSGIIDSAIDGIAKLEPPQWAADQTSNYQRALRDLQSVCQQFTAILVRDKGKSAFEINRAEYVRTQRKLNKAARAEAKTRRKMLRALGAAPTTDGSGDGGEALPPDTQQQT